MTSPTPSRTLAAMLPTVADGSTVTLRGHVHRRRELSSVSFLVVRDRSGLAQVVAAPATPLPPEETVVSVTGIAVTSAKAPGGVEVTEPQITILSEPAHSSPFDLWRPSLAAALPVLLDNAALAWRHPAQRARWEIAAASLTGFRRSLDAQGFTEIQSPKLVSTATESGANVFSVDYFGRPAYLAQSPQLYKQQLVGVFERVYEVGPVFRAEPHDTVRHLAEYVSLDVELGFIVDHRDVLAVLRSVLAGMIEAIQTRSPSHASGSTSCCRSSTPRSLSSTSLRRCAWSAPATTSQISPRTMSVDSVSGPAVPTAATCSRWRAIRRSSVPSTPIPGPAPRRPAARGRTASISYFVEWNW